MLLTLLYDYLYHAVPQYEIRVHHKFMLFHVMHAYLAVVLLFIPIYVERLPVMMACLLVCIM